MITDLHLNPAASYLEKDGCYVIYLDFNYLFLRGTAAEYFSRLLALFDNPAGEAVPKEFIKYLFIKKIITEKKS